ncbi:MAG: hypothetical protein ACERKJ_07865 [Candidatus Dadabacteria bacterium]
MGMLRSIFLRNNDGTVEPGSEPTGAAYVAWKAKNMTSSATRNTQYCLAKMAKYYKILKREGKIPIA